MVTLSEFVSCPPFFVLFMIFHLNKAKKQPVILPESHVCFPCGSAVKESTCNVGYLGSIPGLGRSPGEGKGYPLQYSGLENSMDCTVHGVAKSWTRLSDFHFQVCLAAVRNYNSGHATVITTCKSGKAKRTFFYRGGREVVINKKSIRGNIGV